MPFDRRINGAVGTRLVTKAGSTGLVNLTKVVPILGGIVGGGASAISTRLIGRTAVQWLKDGPPGDDDEGKTIDGVAEAVPVAVAAGYAETSGQPAEARPEA